MRVQDDDGLREYLYMYQIEHAIDRLIMNLSKHDKTSLAADILDDNIKVDSIPAINKIYEEQGLPYREKFISIPKI